MKASRFVQERVLSLKDAGKARSSRCSTAVYATQSSMAAISQRWARCRAVLPSATPSDKDSVSPTRETSGVWLISRADKRRDAETRRRGDAEKRTHLVAGSFSFFLCVSATLRLDGYSRPSLIFC